MAYIIAAIVAPFIGFAGVILVRSIRTPGMIAAYMAIISAGISAALVGIAWYAVPLPIVWLTDWVSALGISIGLYVDHLSLLFALMVAGVSFLSLLYSLHYIPHDLAEHHVASSQLAYYAYMLLFTGAMLGMVFAADLIQLYVFWELTSVASFLLIGLDWGKRESQLGALKALLITASGGLAMLIGFVILSSIAGSSSLPNILGQVDLLRQSPSFAVALLLIVIGAATKSAQFPFHVWLPDAMVAPTPVSAFLHSASLVAAGVYLLARLQPVFAGNPLWFWSLVTIGFASSIVGGIAALKATKIKSLLAYSTIGQYGFIFALIGYGTGGALAGALFNFFQHGILKSALFFIAGNLAYSAGLTRLGHSRDLWRKLPITFGIATVLALSLGGLPVFAGFWRKEVFLLATVETHNYVLIVLGVAASALTLLYMLRFLFGAFVDGDEAVVPSQCPSNSMLFVPGFLAVLTTAFGMFPGIISSAIAEPATRDVLGRTVNLALALHLDERLIPSVIALSVGAVGYLLYRRHHARILQHSHKSLDQAYEALSQIVGKTGQRVLGLQSGSLVMYVGIVLTALLGLIALSIPPSLNTGAIDLGHGPRFNRGLVDWAMAAVLVMISVGTVMTFVLRRHLYMILALSAVGFLIAALFALELAPDVALVQVHVETLVTVLFVLALVLIPRAARQRQVNGARDRARLWNVGVALPLALVFGWISWLAIENAPRNPIAGWFNDNAYELAHADDVVAAILVDFRALDTLGEISVFAAATMGVYLIVRLMQREDQ